MLDPNALFLGLLFMICLGIAIWRIRSDRKKRDERIRSLYIPSLGEEGLRKLGAREIVAIPEVDLYLMSLLCIARLEHKWPIVVSLSELNRVSGVKLLSCEWLMETFERNGYWVRKLDDESFEVWIPIAFILSSADFYRPLNSDLV